MEPEIVEIEAFSILGITTRIGLEHAHEECPKLWTKLQPQMDRIAPEHLECIGVCSEFQMPDDDFAKGSFQYTVGFRPRDVVDNTDLAEAKVLGGRFAKFEHTGKITEIATTIKAIWAPEGWMQTNGEWQHRVEPDFELYGEEWNPDTGTTEIFIPVDPKSAD